MTKIYYYISPSGKDPVKSFLDSLIKVQKAKVFRIFQYIERYGIKAPIPRVKKVEGTPLWEIRTLGRDNIRIIYATIYRGNILALHGFIKKSQKTPAKEIKIALTRYDDWISRQKTKS